MSYDTLLKHLAACNAAPLSAKETALIRASFKIRNFKRREIVLREGDVCRHLLYILRGGLRMYAVDQNGREHTISLSIEDSWICDYESFHSQLPGRYTVMATEACEVFQITQQQLQHLKENSVAVRRMMYRHDCKNIIETQHRVYAANNLSAGERVKQLAATSPAFMDRFPQHVLASYIGITLETLSRIRKQVLEG